MKVTSTRLLVAVLTALAVVIGTAGSASAHEWRAPYDKDDISRSSVSGKAYTKGTLSWQREHVHRPSLQVEDRKASYSLRLYVAGSKKSCGKFRITTYKRKNKAGSPSAVSKRFPSNGGYYSYCPSSGKGSKAYSGADRLDIGQNSYYTQMDRAVVRVCWTRSSSVPPGGDCYQFTVRSGD
ncbi:MAG: hypothetical protein PGN07_02945 [Aeromicrobium erythreum]